MIVEMHNRLRAVSQVRATRLIVYDERTGTPVAVCIESSPGVYHFAGASDPDFNAIMHNMGIDRTVLVDTLDPKSLRGTLQL